MKCVYATNHDIFLDYMLGCCPTETAWFFSNRRWKTARDLLGGKPGMPIFIRRLGDEEIEHFACTHKAELVEILLADGFRSKAELRSWVGPKLEFHRAAYRHAGCDVGVVDKKIGDELDAFLNAETIYAIRRLQPWSMPISDLIKAKGGEPLSGQYPYSYAICRYPD